MEKILKIVLQISDQNIELVLHRQAIEDMFLVSSKKHLVPQITFCEIEDELLLHEEEYGRLQYA